MLLGYSFIALAGLSLGLFGAGGAAIIIPIFIYFFHLPFEMAVTYAMAVVGTTALIGTAQYRKDVSFSRVFFFAIPSVLGVFITRHFLTPRLPMTLAGLPMDFYLKMLLVSLLIAGAFFMIRPLNVKVRPEARVSNFKFLLLGFALGTIMGLVGIGGGFIMVPALVLLEGLPMRSAVGTSLLIISLNSGAGILSHPGSLEALNLRHMSIYMALVLAGMMGGSALSHHIAGEKLKKYFGIFIAILAFTMLGYEINKL